MPYAQLVMSLLLLYAGIRCSKHRRLLVKILGGLAMFTGIDGLIVSFPWIGVGFCLSVCHLYIKGWRGFHQIWCGSWLKLVSLGSICGFGVGIFIRESIRVASGTLMPNLVWAMAAFGSTLVAFWIYLSQAKVQTQNDAQGLDSKSSRNHNNTLRAAESHPYADLYQVRIPRVNFSDVRGQDEIKRLLADAGQAWREGKVASTKHEKKNGVLMFGPPGTGKTMLAEAMASELDIQFLEVSFGDIASKWINQSTEQLSALFTAAKHQSPCMLFIDEIDSLLKASSGNYQEYERMVRHFLRLAEDVRGTDVFLAGATNHYDLLEPAAIREGRFDFKIEVGLPDARAREHLILAGLARASACTDQFTLGRLVQRWAGFNVPRVMDGAREAAAIAKSRGSTCVRYSDFYSGLRKIQGAKAGAPESAKSIDELIMDPDLKRRITEISVQLEKIDELETTGGTIPKGLLFLGPPGTGKTSTAVALAKACGWTFIQRTGKELMESGAIEKLRRQASDLRPAIIFIDEADDILADRSTSPYRAITNELLVLINGASGTLHDVMWIAATNHPENIDEAAFQGGRFTQKIEFLLPTKDTLLQIVNSWAEKYAAYLDEPNIKNWTDKVVPLLLGQSHANALAVLATANNIAATRSITTGHDRSITLEHIVEAAKEVTGSS